MITAEEFLKQYELGNTGKIDIEDAKEAVIEFAKLHVEAALKAAATIEVDGCGCGEADIILKHIDDCYSLDLIK
jgi:hypothetical protein